jgi:hypothetical protein
MKDKLSECKSVQDTFNKVSSWQEKHKIIPGNVSNISELDKLKIQISLDSWMKKLRQSQDLVKDAIKYCSSIWENAVDIIIEFDMPNVQFLGISVLGDSSFSELQQQRKDTKG